MSPAPQLWDRRDGLIPHLASGRKEKRGQGEGTVIENTRHFAAECFNLRRVRFFHFSPVSLSYDDHAGTADLFIIFLYLHYLNNLDQRSSYRRRFTQNCDHKFISQNNRFGLLIVTKTLIYLCNFQMVKWRLIKIE